LNKANGVSIVRQEPFVKNQFLLRLEATSPSDALRTANRFQENPLVLFSHPNFWAIYERNETIPNDPLFGNQWHHRNTGQNGGTVDADADTTLAWDFTTGSANVVIGIVDNGFDLTHQDLSANVFTNPGEISNNGVDDDGNGFVDDVNGWNFIGNNNNPSPVGTGDNHGTAVTGVAVARGNNSLGVAGACWGCRFLPLNVFSNCVAGGGGCLSNDAAFAGAINYAAAMGAKVINNSWGQTSPASTASTVVVNAVNNAAAAGALVLFAGGNSPSGGWCGASYPSLVNVFAVSSSSNQDRKVTGHAFGNCIGILAPTRWGAQDSTPTGTLAVTTTDRTGTAGYNNTDPDCIGGLTEPTNTNYTNCFSGTSSATPLTAGIAGLVLSVNPGLTRWQLQRLLQDTADKIEDSVGAYADATGFSSPGSGIATHSWGRINSFEAVRIAAPVAQGGKGGVDIFVRDNRLDWGNTAQPSNVLLAIGGA
jgi:subtilisin family serine protease